MHSGGSASRGSASGGSASGGSASRGSASRILHSTGVCIQGGLHPGESACGGSASRRVCIKRIGQSPPRVCLQGGWADTPKVCLQVWLGRLPQETWDTMGYGQQVGGTHPTGMHSCFKNGCKCRTPIYK